MAFTKRVVALLSITGFGVAVNAVICNVVAAFTVKVSGVLALCWGLDESVTVTVTVYVPVEPGVHERVAVSELVHPVGRPL